LGVNLQAQLIDDQLEQDATSDRRRVISDGRMQRIVTGGHTCVCAHACEVDWHHKQSFELLGR
jgi:hypothetical protein